MTVLDEKAKSYLIACLVTGIDVIEKPPILMNGLVDHLNSTERVFWAQGDEDGVIVHDKDDIPVLYLMFDGKRITFNAFEQDEFSAFGPNKMIGFALLNVIGFLQDNAYDFGPSILGTEASVVSQLMNTTNRDEKPEDWSL